MFNLKRVTMSFWLFSLCMEILLVVFVFALEKYLDLRIFPDHIKGDTDGDNTGSFMMFGLRYIGLYRYDEMTKTGVSYLFLCIFVPLIPVSCVIKTENKHDIFNSTPEETIYRYSVLGNATWSFLELLHIYLSIIAYVNVLFLIVTLYIYIKS